VRARRGVDRAFAGFALGDVPVHRRGVLARDGGAGVEAGDHKQQSKNQPGAEPPPTTMHWPEM